MPCRTVHRARSAPGPGTQRLLVVVFDFFELGIDHIVCVSLVLVGIGLGITLGRLLFIHFLHYRCRGFGQGIDLRLDGVLVVTLDRFFQLSQG